MKNHPSIHLFNDNNRNTRERCEIYWIEFTFFIARKRVGLCSERNSTVHHRFIYNTTRNRKSGTNCFVSRRNFHSCFTKAFGQFGLPTKIRNLYYWRLLFSTKQTTVTIQQRSWLIFSQCTLSFPPENIKKPYGFLMFSAVDKGCIGNEWVNRAIRRPSIV